MAEKPLYQQWYRGFVRDEPGTPRVYLGANPAPTVSKNNMPNTAANGASAISYGKTLVEWESGDVPTYQRSRRWYIIVGMAGGLMIAYSLWTANYTFVLLILLFALTFILVWRQSHRIRIKITEGGVAAGEIFYPYRELKKFWLLYQPPDVKMLYLEFRNPLRPRLSIPLENQNPVAVRHALLDYLIEDLHQEEEPPLDQISRMLKL